VIGSWEENFIRIFWCLHHRKDMVKDRLRQLPVRIVRRLSIEEVRRRIRVFERKYPRGFEDLQDRFNRGGERELLEDYMEWSYMVHALGAYREGEEFDCVVEEEQEVAMDLFSGLTPKRVELLYAIPRLPVSSVNSLAERVGRDVKNVYGDLRSLEKLGFVRLRKVGRSLVPELLIEEISFIFE